MSWKETTFDVAEMRTLISRFAGKRADHVVFDIHSKHHNLYTLGTVILHILWLKNNLTTMPSIYYYGKVFVLHNIYFIIIFNIGSPSCLLPWLPKAGQ